MYNYATQEAANEILRDVLFEQVLGYGAFATIYKGRLSVGKHANADDSASCSEVAVKVLRKRSTENEWESALHMKFQLTQPLENAFCEKLP